MRVQSFFVLLCTPGIRAFCPSAAPAARERATTFELHASKPGALLKLPDLSQANFPDVPDEPYDLVVLGSGPAGETAAAHAAQLGARVAVVEVKRSFGGPTGLTSKAVREAAKQICKAVDQVGGDRRRQIRRLWTKRFPALRGEAEVLQAAETRDRLNRNQCDLYIGAAELLPHSSFGADDDDAKPAEPAETAAGTVVARPLAVRVCRPTGCVELEARRVVVATGSRPHRPERLPSGVQMPFTPGRVVDATEVAKLSELPNAVAVLGGGVIAVEYATVLAQLGVGVSLLCSERSFMPFLSSELRAALRRRMARDRVLFLDAEIERIDVGSDGLVRVLLEAKPRQPRRLRVDLLLYSGGRDANSQDIGCDAVGVATGRFGRIAVDGDYRTANPNVFAVGDVIGPPGLASAAQQQARYVTDLLFRKEAQAKAERLRNAMLESSCDIEDVVDDDFFSGSGSGGGGGGWTDGGGGWESAGALGAWAAAAGTAAPGGSGAAGSSASGGGDGEGEEDKGGGTGGMTLFGRNRIDAPLTLWTIPEIASVGLPEETARAAAAADTSFTGGSAAGAGGESDAAAGGGAACAEIVVGRAYFKDLARGRLSGDLDGFLSIVARAEGPQRHVIVGVHIAGEGANELIQLGSILVHSGATLEQVSNTPFAAVTLSGLYQMASDDALCNSPLNLLRQPRVAAAPPLLPDREAQPVP